MIYKPLSLGAIREFWKSIDEAAALTDSTAAAIQAAFKRGRMVGQAEGARRERRALLMAAGRLCHPETTELIRRVLASLRKRKGGK